MALPAPPRERDSTNVLLEALPPATSYIDYLTLLEYNLDKASLPLLHRLLQDPHLTIKIGWDLVHLLLPLLPESEQCLLDIAKLGNPREVVLKTAESLEEIERSCHHDPQGKASADGESPPGGVVADARSNSPRRTDKIVLLKFKVLASMLCILHPRVKTPRPSRFLQTSASALRTAFNHVVQSDAAMKAILELAQGISRAQSLTIVRERSGTDIVRAGPVDSHLDPEAVPEALVTGEAEQIRTILRCLLSWCLGRYMDSLSAVAQSSPLAWADRYIESRERRGVSIMRQSYRRLHEAGETLEARENLMRETLSLLDTHLSMPWIELLDVLAAKAGESSPWTSSFALQDFEPSKKGLLYLMAMKTYASLRDCATNPFELALFPCHKSILDTFVRQERFDELSPALLDSLLLLGWAALQWSDGRVDPPDDATFFEYLNQLNMISACTEQPCLRYNYHVYSSTVLHSHPSSQTRLDYIKDTLEHCPFPSLKVVAIDWLKDEIGSAFGLRAGGPVAHSVAAAGDSDGNIFRSPVAITSTAAHVFPQPDEMKPEDAEMMLPFWIAATNFLYFLRTSQRVLSTMDVPHLLHDNAAARTFREAGMARLDEIMRAYDGPLEADPALQGHSVRADLYALEDALRRAHACFSGAT